MVLKFCLSVTGGQQGWGGDCGEVGKGEALFFLSELLLFAGRVFLRHPLPWLGALWLRNTECKTEEMTRQSLPSSSGPSFLQEPILDLRLSPQFFTQETPTPGDRKWLSARQKGS